MIPSVGSDKYLGNYISTDIVNSVYDLYQRNNWVITEFRVCDSSTLDNLHRTYSMHVYGCELCALNCNYRLQSSMAQDQLSHMKASL